MYPSPLHMCASTAGGGGTPTRILSAPACLNGPCPLAPGCPARAHPFGSGPRIRREFPHCEENIHIVRVIKKKYLMGVIVPRRKGNNDKRLDIKCHQRRNGKGPRSCRTRDTSRKRRNAREIARNACSRTDAIAGASPRRRSRRSQHHRPHLHPDRFPDISGAHRIHRDGLGRSSWPVSGRVRG